MDCGLDLKKRVKDDARDTVGRDAEPEALGIACGVSEKVTDDRLRTDFSSERG
jgi:hypothetical protein